MRINVYNEELTFDVQVVKRTPRPGREYIGLRFFLESSDKLHNVPEDDDRSAVTLWVGSKSVGKRLLSVALDSLVRYDEETEK